MKVSMLQRLATVAFALLALLPNATRAQLSEEEPEQSATEAPSTESESEAPDLDELESFSIPGEPHELLATTVGSWDVTIRIWSDPDPEAEPASETEGTAVGRWILGERFVETLYEGEVLGRPFEGLKIEGFEKAIEKYVSTWRDNLGTYTLVFKGECEESCRERTMDATFTDPVSKLPFRLKGVTTIEDEDNYTYQSFVITPNGQEFKNMELEARRRH
ncbi:MAG: DUF1579 domain-containing protein [Acidobacteriota bacterium]